MVRGHSGRKHHRLVFPVEFSFNACCVCTVRSYGAYTNTECSCLSIVDINIGDVLMEPGSNLLLCSFPDLLSPTLSDH